MAKLFFYYSTMNAGKSTNLLQASYNYKERGFNTVLFNFHLDRRDHEIGSPTHQEPADDLFITCRINISEKAHPFNQSTNFLEEFERIKQGDLPIKDQEGHNRPIGAILVDEAQFLTCEQVKQLSDIVDYQGVPVLCYGIRTDFKGEPFEGSSWLLAWADEIVELKTICSTGKKATFVLRLNEDGEVEREGAKLKIGGNDLYVAVSRKIHKDAIRTGKFDYENMVYRKPTTD